MKYNNNNNSWHEFKLGDKIYLTEEQYNFLFSNYCKCKMIDECGDIDNSSKTDNKMIIRANEEMIEWSVLKPILADLKNAAKNSESDEIYKLLMKIVPGFNPDIKGEKEIKK